MVACSRADRNLILESMGFVGTARIDILRDRTS
jgi:hypothetical protein